MKISREVKTALLVILGVISLYFGYNFLKKQSVFNGQATYKTQFDYNGLAISAPVTIKGNPIGKVERIDYNYSTGKTDIQFSVDKRLKFPTNSVVRLYEEGIMGGPALAIIPGDGNDIAPEGAFITSAIEESMVKALSKNFSGLSENLDSTLKDADSLMINLNAIVADDSEKGLKQTLAELNATLRSFKSLSYSLNKVVKDNDDKLATVLDNFNKVSQDFAVMSNDLKQANFGQTVKNLETTLTNVNTLLADFEKGNGTLGKLMKDDKLYHNLEVSSYQLKELLQDFKLNPKRYIHVSVFGKKAKPYVEPEDERE